MDRFDDILERALKNHGFRDQLKVQNVAFSPEFKELLCQILRVTKLIFVENSSREVYGSASV